MQPWGWLAGYAALFALLHAALYHYYLVRDGRESTAGSALADGPYSGSGSEPGPDRSPHRGSARDGADSFERAVEGESVTCARCGAPNAADAAFTYCWNCVSTLDR